MVERFKRILTIENAVQAQILDALLAERSIPHAMVSYRDSVYDGIYQMGKGWGHVEASAEHEADILAIYEEMSQSDDFDIDEESPSLETK